MKNLLLRSLVVAALLALPLAASADPCLTVYPDANVVYHYGPTEYYTVGPMDPLYDAAYDLGGEVLIDLLTMEIAYNIYQAPGLIGFLEDAMDQGYFTMDHEFDIIIDGFSNMPLTYENVILVFDWVEPEACVPMLLVNGMAPTYDPVFDGWTYPAGDLVVMTPTPDGMNYSDTISLPFSWSGCQTVRIWAFADDNYNGTFDSGEECFSAYSHDLTVPAEDTSWGRLKSLYEE